MPTPDCPFCGAPIVFEQDEKLAEPPALPSWFAACRNVECKVVVQTGPHETKVEACAALAIRGNSEFCGNCHKCLNGILTEGGLPITATRMILCPTCGNKRCPKATDHRFECTNSNDPGQPGSVYA